MNDQRAVEKTARGTTTVEKCLSFDRIVSVQLASPIRWSRSVQLRQTSSGSLDATSLWKLSSAQAPKTFREKEREKFFSLTTTLVLMCASKSPSCQQATNEKYWTVCWWHWRHASLVCTPHNSTSCEVSTYFAWYRVSANRNH